VRWPRRCCPLVSRFEQMLLDGHGNRPIESGRCPAVPPTVIYLASSSLYPRPGRRTDVAWTERKSIECLKGGRMIHRLNAAGPFVRVAVGMERGRVRGCVCVTRRDHASLAGIFIYVFIIHRSGRNKKTYTQTYSKKNRKQTQKYLSNK